MLNEKICQYFDGHINLDMELIFTTRIDYCVYCELIPNLGDDYPCVLRKMSNQIRLDNNPSNNYYCLIIENFNSISTDIQTLRKIFSQYDIFVILTDEIFKNVGTENELLKN